VGAPPPIRIVRDHTLVTQMTQGPSGSAQKRWLPGDAHVTPLSATRTRLILGSASDGGRDALSRSCLATDDMHARASARTTAAALREGTSP
jgi:hypothetical protein